MLPFFFILTQSIPAQQYYNMWLSLLGAMLCVAVMFLISWTTALLTFTVTFVLYLIVSYGKPGNINLEAAKI